MAKKSRNGYGDQYLVSISFNENNPDDIDARNMAAQLAETKDLSKVVKAFLLSLYDYQSQHGVVLTPERIMSMVVSGLIRPSFNPDDSLGVIDTGDLDITFRSASAIVADELTARHMPVLCFIQCAPSVILTELRGKE